MRRTARRCTTCLAILALAFAFTPRLARAEETPEARAERLFEEARQLAEKGEYAAACPKLEESERLDPGLGTEFNLADCYEHVGRTATAYRRFTDVATTARAAGKTERASAARARASALEPKLAKLSVRVPSAPGLEIRIDGELVDSARAADWPVDPGDHTVRASAADRLPREVRVTVAPEAKAAVDLPALAERPRATVVRTVAVPSRGGTQRTIGWIAGGVGLAGVAVGSVAGVVALGKHGDAQNACPDPKNCPTAESAQTWTDATRWGDVSTVGFVVGGVGIATAAVLLLTAPKGTATPSKTTAWAIAPGPGGGGLRVVWP